MLKGPPRRGGRQVTMHALLTRRCEWFQEGRWQELWEEVRYRRRDAPPPRSDKSIANQAIDLAREGLYSKAAQAVEQLPSAPSTQATHIELQRLNPDGSLSGPMPDLPRALPQNPIDPYLFFRCFLSPPPEVVPTARRGGEWRTTRL